MDPSVIWVVIPVISIVMGLSYAMFVAYLKHRRDTEALRLSHAERLAAIEKGIELPLPPPPPSQELRPTLQFGLSQKRRMGLILLFGGLAITLAIWLSGGGGYLSGLLPAAVGLALVIATLLDARDERSSSSEGPSPPQI